MSKSRTTKPALTIADLEACYDDERWGGWGYLGGRQQLSEAQRADGDRQVLEYANSRGWSAERLFLWVNSRPGRHFAVDVTLGWVHSLALIGARLEGVGR